MIRPLVDGFDSTPDSGFCAAWLHIGTLGLAGSARAWFWEGTDEAIKGAELCAVKRGCTAEFLDTFSKISLLLRFQPSLKWMSSIRLISATPNIDDSMGTETEFATLNGTG